MNTEPINSSSSGRDKRLENVLIDCEEAMDRGQALDRQELVVRYPEFTAELAEFFADRDRIEKLAQPLRALAPKDPQKTDAGPQLGTTLRYFGDYELLEEIARGGMGVVYRARQVSLNRIVALKMILAGQLASAVDVQRFHSEAEAAANLDHPNIVPIYEVGEHEGQHFFSMKLIQGPSLARAISDFRFQIADFQRHAARLLATIACAVHFAHQRGIIHRDLKPANILLQIEDCRLQIADLPGRSAPAGKSAICNLQYAIPSITDFGLAKRLHGEPGLLAPGGLSQSGAIVGTPAYMAPEQAAGNKGLTTAADVYSLGAILYELLTGKPPFVGSTPMDVLLQVMDNEPTPPRQVQPGIDRDLETICLKCLAKDPQKRYGTAEALAEDLRRFQAGEPILARPVGSVERLWRWCRRKPAAAALAALIILAPLAIVVTLAVAFFMVRDSRDEALESANNALKAKADADERRREAEILVVRVKFEQAFQQRDENRALAMLSTAGLLRDAIALKDRQLQDSLRLHLGSWFQEAHRLKCIFSHAVIAVAFSPDGKTMLTGGGDGTARLWETATGKPLGLPLQHQNGVRAVAFSPDGKTLLTGSGNNMMTGRENTGARLWDTATGKPLVPPLQHGPYVDAVAFSPDGKTVLTGGDRKARLWDTGTGKPLGRPLQHQNGVRAVAFSPDGKTVLTGGGDGTARLWETATGNQFGPRLRHGAYIMAVAFSPDSKTVLTGSSDRTARLWETVTGNQLGPPLQHQGPVTAVAFSPDGKTVLTGSHDQTARLWETATGKALGPPLQHHAIVWAVAFSPDGKTVLTGSSTGGLWETATGAQLGPPLQHQHEVGPVAFSPDGKTVLTGSYDRTARLWETSTGEQLGPPLPHQANVWAVAFSPDGKTVLTGSGNFDLRKGEARLWETATSHPLGPPLQHQNSVVAVAFSPDGKTLLTGSNDNTARLWETATSKALGRPWQHQSWVVAVAFSPDGKTVLTGSDDKTARLWETATAKQLRPPLLHQGQVRAVAFSPDGKTVLTGSLDSTARLWQTVTGKALGPLLQHGAYVWAVAFSPDGKTVLTGSFDHSARLWETATGKPFGPPLQHQGAVRAVAFSPDGKTVLTGSEDHTARLWRVPLPIQGDPARVLLWAQVITGMELDDYGQARVLDAKTWQKRRHRLEKLGGPPAK
jgi:WD40 repeat protein/serine/threonine protein kinase